MSTSIVCDSINPRSERITTFHLTDLSIRELLDFRTHRVVNGFEWESESWSVASSRVLSPKEIAGVVRVNPLSPVPDGKWYYRPLSAKMGRGEFCNEVDTVAMDIAWHNLAERAADFAIEAVNRGVHPELCNSFLHPFIRYSAVVTATSWAGFFEQRAIPDTLEHGPRRECRLRALEMKRLYDDSNPTLIGWGGLHLPFTTSEDGTPEQRITLSVARCARATNQKEGQGDERLTEWLRAQTPPHKGPFEHVARAERGCHANYTGWESIRCSSWPE